MTPLHCNFRLSHRLLWALLLAGPTAHAQSGPAPNGSDGRHELAAKLELLTKSLEQTQIELVESRAELQQLRSALQEVLARIDKLALAATGAAQESAGTLSFPAVPPSSPGADEARGMTQISQDDWEILNARVEEQRQTKVESASKYRLKLSGIALFNAFGTFGKTDNVDVPGVALYQAPGYSTKAVGASVRQSIVGLTGIGPVVFGARTSGDLQIDFYGGLPSGYNATSSGIAEVRQARMRFDWRSTSVVAGLDYPFFSPNLPTTYMSVAVPGFASAGNLWTWTPTVRVERRFAGALSPFKIEAGFLDPPSNINYAAATNLRAATPTESSRQPTYAVRLSANAKSENRYATIGVSGVYSPQRFTGGYAVDGWGGMADWKLAFVPRTELSGQFFTGRGLDGFGGVPVSAGQPANAVLYATVTAPVLANLGVIGGWSQFKIRVDARNEFNVAAGTGGRNSAGLREAAAQNLLFASVPARNQMFFVNYIFRPRSDLLFSAEYRRLRTYALTGSPHTAGQLGLAMGFLF
jgi:hypothetical protein